jgi:oligopeptidase A
MARRSLHFATLEDIYTKIIIPDSDRISHTIMNANAIISHNPLLKGAGLPTFTEIQPAQVVPAFQQLIAELDTELTNLETNLQPTWSGLVEPLDKLTERLSWSWGIINHLMGVKNSPELREAHEAVQPQVVEFFTKLGQSQPLYKAFKALRSSEAWNSLEPAQQRIVEAAIRDAELSGVGLQGEAKERFNAIQLELAELSSKFSNHVLDATKAFSLTLTSRNRRLTPKLTQSYSPSCPCSW